MSGRDTTLATANRAQARRRICAAAAAALEVLDLRARYVSETDDRPRAWLERFARGEERIGALESALRASLARWRAARGRFDPRPDCDVCGVRLAADGAETHDAECAVGRDLRVLGGGAT